MQTQVTFLSDGLKLAGILHIPDGASADAPRPAFLVMHGFGTSKDGSTPEIIANMLEEWGYIALRFDFRCCGQSEGERGHLLCLDQVEDTKNAVTFLGARDDVDAARIGVIGHSFGAAVAVYAGGVDERIAAVVSSCGWGDGERKFRGQHKGEAWNRFTAMLKAGKKHRENTGEPLMVSRWDIVPIPEHLRGLMGPDAILEFPAETAHSMYDFVADDVVGQIAPRPLLLFHAANDSVTPTEQSLELFKRAGQPTDLMLLAEVDHFPFSVGAKRARDTLKSWLDQNFPAGT
jgi:alpha/beta superfamily hydrolase